MHENRKELITYLQPMDKPPISFICQDSTTATMKENLHEVKPKRWFYSSATSVVTELETIFGVKFTEQERQQFLIELAVAGGNLYRLILGEH